MTRAAIDHYLEQTYQDRELVIVIDQGPDRAAWVEMIAAYRRDDIAVLLPDRPMPLGALRNMGVARATGDIICQWDDDDRHHPGRITAQTNALDASGCDASILQDVLMCDAITREVRWTNWAATPVGGHPATFVCRRDRAPIYPETGPEAQLGEDVAALLPMRKAGSLHTQVGDPQLYVYVSHVQNASGRLHHAMLAESLAISTGLLRRREAALRGATKPLRFASGTRFVGLQGEAFRL